MFTKDTFRLIKKTFNRFISLVCIVFIGVAFMMGLLSTRNIMQRSVDVYNDENHLQDLQLYSSYGFDENDIKELKKLDCVEEVFASRFKDVYIKKDDGTSRIARLREIESKVNQIVLVDGRMPLQADEALILGNSNSSAPYQLGTKVTCSLESDDLEESVINTTFTIVGRADSPEYMAKFLSTSTLDNRDLDLVLYIPAENFIAEYYTSVYVSVSGAKELNGYSKQYLDLIEEAKDEIEGFASHQQEHLKATILQEYYDEIEEGKEELEKGRIEGQEKLDEAKAKLDEAHIQLVVGQLQIDTNKETIESSKKKLADGKYLLDVNAPTINNAIREIEEESGLSFEQTYTSIQASYYTYLMLENQVGNQENIQNATTAKNNLLQQKTDNLARIDEIDNVDLPAKDAEIAAKEAEISAESDPAVLDTLNNELNQLRLEKAGLTAEKNTLVSSNQTIDNTIAGLDSVIDGSTDNTIREAMDRIDAAANGDVKTTYIQMTQLKDAKEKMDAGYKEIADGEKELEKGEAQLLEAEKTLQKGWKEYEKGLKEYEDGVIEYRNEIEKAELDIRKAEQDLADLPDAKWMILDHDSHYSSLMYKNTTNQMGAIGITMPVLFYLVAALVCMTTMTRLVDEQRGQIGIYRALGFSKNQVIGKYVFYALFASLIGSVFGVGVGMALFPTVIYEAWHLMYILPSMQMYIPIDKLFICVGAFSLLMMGVTGFVVNKSLKEVPSQLMRPKAPKNAKAVFLEKIPFIWNNLSFTSKITARNLIRYKTRFFMTVIGVAGCTGLLVLGWGIRDSISDVVNVQYGDFLTYNYTVSLENDDHIEQVLDVLEKDLDNEHIVPVMSYMSKVYLEDDDTTINVEVMNARGFSEVYALQKKGSREILKMNNNSVIISEKFARTNHLDVGDTIEFESRSGLKATAKIGAICKMYFQHYLYISEDLYHTLFDQNVHYTSIAVTNLTDGEVLRAECEQLEGVSNVSDFTSFTDQFNTMIKALDLIIAVIIVTAGSLAFVVLINLTQVNISERIREIATLKVLGFRVKEVNSYIFKEVFLLTVIGGLIGLPLGQIEQIFVMRIIDMEMVMFPTRIKPFSFVIAYVITMIFTGIVLFLMRKPLRKIEMVESLKSVE